MFVIYLSIDGKVTKMCSESFRAEISEKRICSKLLFFSMKEAKIAGYDELFKK